MRLQGNTFPKSERLCSRKAIEAIFAGGNRAFSAFPLRAVYKITDMAGTAGTTSMAVRPQVLISVSKRHFKHAVDRNRAKRQIRDAWRRNRDLLNETSVEHNALHIAFIWLADEPQPSSLVHRKMKNLLHRIAESIQMNPDKALTTSNIQEPT